MVRHLISTNDLSNDEIKDIFLRTSEISERDKTLQNKRFITIFFENSTRTLSSFEIAIKNLGGEVIRLDIANSSTAKGESIADTAATLNAMQPHAIITRHKSAGAPNFLAQFTSCPIVNGGDGAHAHPTQALLDLYTMSMHFGEKYYENNNILDKKLQNLDSKNSLDSMESKSQDSKKNIESNSQNLIEKKQKACIKGLELMQNKRIAIVGDIKNSRVANSNIELLSRFGVDITLVAPPHFLYKTRLKTAHNLQEIIDNVDIIMALRTQTERHNTQIYGSLKDYANRFCITRELLGSRDIIVLHPGPVHRNIDIDDEMLSDKRSKVLKQVQNGVKIRMSVMEFLCKDFTL